MMKNIDVEDEKFRNTKKMPALFVIDRVNHIAVNEINEKAEWLFQEKATATVKIDGTGILIDSDGNAFARRSVKKGKKAPENYIEFEIDFFTGHSFGIEPIEQSGFKKFFYEALDNFEGDLEQGTYELIGSKINKRYTDLDKHVLAKHGSEVAITIPDMRNIDPNEAYEILEPLFAQFKKDNIEGIVWAGADGKRVKLRVADFFGDDWR